MPDNKIMKKYVFPKVYVTEYRLSAFCEWISPGKDTDVFDTKKRKKEEETEEEIEEEIEEAIFMQMNDSLW